MTIGRILQRFLAVMVLTCMSVTVLGAPQWEKIANRQSEIVETVEGTPIDCRVVDGALIVSLNAKTEVKVFTILGQLVARQQLEAGTWRLLLPARGIYILKAGALTRRVTV